MTDKVTNQIQEMLDGRGRYKLLDPNRKAVLLLPPSAFKLWMTYWMFESDSQEAYPSMETLVKVTGMTEKTIRTAREYLLKTGWLVRLTGSAAERFIKPSNGSWNVAIYRVDDPQKSTPENLTGENLTGEEMTLPKNPPNVSTAFASAVAFASTAVPTHASTCTRSEPVPSEESSLREDEKQKPQQPQQQKQQPRPTSATKWLARYGEEKPADFESWSQVERTRWCVEHEARVSNEAKLASQKVPSTVDEPRPGRSMSTSPHADATPQPVPPPPEPEPEPEPEPDYIPTPAQCRCDWCGVNVPAEFIDTHKCEGWSTTTKSKPSLRCPDCGDLKEDCLCY